MTLFVEDLDAAKTFYAKVFGLPVHYEEISGANHYTILNDMLRADGRIHQAVMVMVGVSPSVSTPPGN